jgi:hypothetical protein
MKIYLGGVEYKTYREIMINLGVRFGCINYEYIWARTPRFSLREDCDSFEGLIATPGMMHSDYQMNDYTDFLNENADLFDFALAPFDLDCEVKILPFNTGHEYYVTYGSFSKPFAPQKYKQAAAKGDIIHGVEFEMPWMDSYNTGTWMRGKAGWISEFTKRSTMQVHPARYTRAAFARMLVEKGYKLDLNKIKRDDWKEVAKFNGLSWKIYQDEMEDR